MPDHEATEQPISERSTTSGTGGRLWPHVLKSIVVHAAIIALLLQLVKTQTEKIQGREREFLAEQQRQRELEDEEQRQEEAKLIHEELRDRLVERLDQFAAGELELSDLDQLTASLDDLVDSELNDQEVDRWTDERFAQAEKRLYQRALDEFCQGLDGLAEQLVLAELDRYINEILAPTFQKRCQKELADRTGPVVTREVAKTVGDRPELQRPSSGRVLLRKLEPLLRTTVKTDIEERAAPNMTGQLMTKVNTQLQTLGWTELTITKNLDSTVRTAITQAATGARMPNVSLALAQARLVYQTGDSASDETPLAGKQVDAMHSRVAASAKESVEAAAKNIVADLELSAAAKSRLAQIDHVSRALDSMYNRPGVFRLGHSTWEYSDMIGEGEEGAEGSSASSGSASGSPLVASGKQTANSVSKGHHGSGDYDGYVDADTVNRYAKVNHGVYRLYRNFAAARGAATSEATDAAEGLAAVTKASVAGADAVAAPAKVFVEDRAARPLPPPNDQQRRLPKPPFKTLAAGAAQFQRTPLIIDGDLSDWKKLRHPLRMRWTFSGQRLEDGVTMHVRWSQAGFYFAYRVAGKTKIEPNLKTQWEGDCFEVWFDIDNLRKQVMENSPNTQQFCLMPFGFAGNRDHTFVEIGRGFRGMKLYEAYLETETDTAKARGKAVGQVEADGYVVEGFIHRKSLANPRLKAGMYLGMNVSINMSYEKSISQQWSLPKALQTFNKPDTWGDLLLLGTDATVRFVDPTDAGQAPEAVIAGQPVGVEVTDRDQNQDPALRDKLLAAVQVKGSRSYLYLILQETNSDSGVFRGSFNTQPYFLRPRENTLNVRDGQPIVLTYRDAQSSHGERDRAVSVESNVGIPIYRLGQE